jgi:anaerobic magnesium-protoporphyrin IX monomethyl ester cyclase
MTRLPIVLCKCPRAERSHFVENCECLALGYLAATLRRDGFADTRILDGCLEHLSIHELVSRVEIQQPRLIGFTISDQTFFESTFEVVRSLRNRGVSAHVVLGGYAPSFEYEETLRVCRGIDSVVRFDGEVTLLALARALETGQDWRSIPGIVYRDGDRIRVSPPASVIRDLDELPFPARDWVPTVLDSYGETGVISLATSRGCYANCSFCSIRAFADGQGAPSLRIRSVSNVVDEIEQLVDRFGRREFVIVDDVFLYPGPRGIRRLGDFITEFERRGLRVMLAVSERASNINDDVCARFRQMGIRQVLIGVEAGSNELLKDFNKHTTVEQNEEAIATLYRHGIDPQVSFINFAPAVRMQQLRSNVAFLLRLNVNFLQGLINRFQIHAGTGLGDQMLRDPRRTGAFPRFDYVADDPLTDRVYRIIQRSCGQFLTTAFELKRIERRLRRWMFMLEEVGGAMTATERAKAEFLRLQQSIMQQAGEIFLAICDDVESGLGGGQDGLDMCVTRFRARVHGLFEAWRIQLGFFEDCCSGYPRRSCYVETRGFAEAVSLRRQRCGQLA